MNAYVLIRLLENNRDLVFEINKSLSFYKKAGLHIKSGHYIGYPSINQGCITDRWIIFVNSEHEHIALEELYSMVLKSYPPTKGDLIHVLRKVETYISMNK